MNELTETALWRKAAVLGSLWASSEVVLGSFLHNAHIPLRGQILTFIGIAILTAGHRLWPQRGLLWRAGFICAAMKSISPSAVIFGPMLAISIQGLLLELGTMAAGVPYGYFLGGGLAMAWNLLYKIAKILLFYGPGAAVLYGRGWERVCAWLGLSSWGPWTPLFALAVLNFLGGVLAVLAGLRVADAPAPAPSAVAPVLTLKTPTGRDRSWRGFFSYLGRILKRPKLWSGVLIASVLAGLLLGRSGAEKSWTFGLIIGLRMGLRAIALTVCFAALGWWLRDQRVRSWLERGRSRLFLRTLDSAFSVLPAIIAQLPSGRDFARRPLACLRHMLAGAPGWLEAFVQDGPPK